MTREVRDACLCLRVHRAARALAGRFDHALRPLGLINGQFSLLMSLNRPESPEMGAVASLPKGGGCLRAPFPSAEELAAELAAAQQFYCDQLGLKNYLLCSLHRGLERCRTLVSRGLARFAMLQERPSLTLGSRLA